MIRWLICGSAIWSVYGKDDLDQKAARPSIFGTLQHQSPSVSDEESEEEGRRSDLSSSLKPSSSPAGVHFRTPLGKSSNPIRTFQTLPDGHEPAGSKADCQVYSSLTPQSLEESKGGTPHAAVSSRGMVGSQIQRKPPPNDVGGLTVHVGSPPPSQNESDDDRWLSMNSLSFPPPEAKLPAQKTGNEGQPPTTGDKNQTTLNDPFDTLHELPKPSK